MTGVRPTFAAIAAIALIASAALLAAGCGADGDAGNPESKLTADQATTQLDAGAPPQLAALREQGNLILDEGTEGFENRIAALEGTPVVVNKWASWCGPCRLEFPFFQSQASERGSEVGFVGVGSNDSTDALETFLSELPLPYPTYHDPDQEIAKQLGGATQAFPATAFYDSAGRRVYTHSGQYRSEEDLAADIDRYAK